MFRMADVVENIDIRYEVSGRNDFDHRYDTIQIERRGILVREADGRKRKK